MTTILLVDDDPFQSFQRKSLLLERFPNVERVTDPAEALCLVEQPRFRTQLGLVICALQMPGISGPAFVQEMQERLPYVPVLVLGGRDEKAADYPGGWVWFLPRPISNSDLLTAADQLILQYSWKSA